jgi:2-dehydro-3-deoxyphosphogluconate aldolase/(4S)-4-hydroxy-2-oxoglutarate aldolase
VDAGAKYIVSPGLDEAVVAYCVSHSIPIVPGAITPTEIQKALSMGLTTVKFFPADAFGGLKTIKALAAPLSAVRFIPTGGISAANLAEYLSFKPIIACGGSWVVTKDLLAAKNWAEITRLAAESVKIVQSVNAGASGK